MPSTFKMRGTSSRLARNCGCTHLLWRSIRGSQQFQLPLESNDTWQSFRGGLITNCKTRAASANLCTLTRLTPDWKETNLLWVTYLINFGRVKHMTSFEDSVIFFIIDTFLEWTEYLRYHNDKITPIQNAFSFDPLVRIFHFFVWEGTIWTGQLGQWISCQKCWFCQSISGYRI